jgi:hypothetical protein
MALPLLFFIGSSIVRAATPAIARLLVQQGYKRASSAVVKNTLKTAKKIRTIGRKKDVPIAKNKSLTIPKNQSTALTKINKGTSGGKSNLGGKVVAGGAFATTAAVSADADKKKGQAQAATKNVKNVLREKQNLEAANYSTMKGTKNKKNKALSIIKKDTNIKTDKAPKKKVIVTKEQLDKSGLSLRDYMNFMQGKTRRDDKKSPVKKSKSKVMVDSFKKSNVKADKNKKAGINGAKVDNKKVKKKVDKKKTESKLDSKGNYKGTNIKPTKLQLERLKKRGLA